MLLSFTMHCVLVCNNIETMLYKFSMSNTLTNTLQMVKLCTYYNCFTIFVKRQEPFRLGNTYLPLRNYESRVIVRGIRSRHGPTLTLRNISEVEGILI